MAIDASPHRPRITCTYLDIALDQALLDGVDGG